MKIKVSASVSKSSLEQTFSFEELGVTQQQWNAMNDEEKMGLIQDAIDGQAEEPFWMAENFTIIP